MKTHTYLALLAGASASAFAQGIDYGDFVHITESSEAWGVRPLDVNQDGATDLVFASRNSSDVTWQRATLPGEFAPPETLARLQGDATAPASVRDVALLDFLGTGSSDLVVIQGIDQRLLRLPRTGPDSFGPAVTIAQGAGPANAVIAVDVDGDGDEDLVVGGSFSSEGTWLFENIGGSLTASPTRIGKGGRLLEPTDFDLDGDLDFVTANSDFEFFALRNDGPGAGFRSTLLGSTPNTSDISIGDTNGDGFVDVAVSGPQAFTVRIFLGNANGVFALDTSTAFSINHPGVPRLELIDLDGDGDLDIAFSPLNAARIDWIENYGTTFGSLARPLLAANGVPYFFTKADLDGDGAMDFISSGVLVVEVALTGGTGIPRPLQETTRRWKTINDSIAFDADADGDLDVVVLSDQDGVGIAINDGTGKLAFPELIAGPQPLGTWPRRAFASDVDGDGRDDLFVRTQAGDVLLARQMVGGGFAPPLYIGMSEGGAPRTADVDLDGDLDIVAQLESPSRLVAYLQSGSGSFSSATTVALLYGDPINFEFRHMDTDGVMDIVTNEDGPPGQRNRTFVYYGLATGNYEPQVEIPTPGDSPQGMQLFEDFDGDGDIDVIYAEEFCCSGNRAILWTRNVGGTRLFAAPAPIGQLDSSIVTRISLGESSPGGPKVLAVGSFVGTLERYRLFEVTPSNRLGTSQQVDVFGSRSSAMYFADLGTGAQDLVLSDRFLDRLGVVYNNNWRDVGKSYCGPAVPNSSGQPGRITAFGSTDATLNTFDLVATQLPAGVTTLLLASLTSGFITNPGGSDGNLCLGGQIGRLTQAGLVGPSSSDGVFRRTIDLTSIPQGNSSVPALSQSTWRFQAWHRDQFMGQGPTSNFTDGVAVTYH